MAFLGYNPKTGHYEFDTAADLAIGQYAPGANWWGKTAHITTANTVYLCTLNAAGTAHQWLQLATAAAVLIPDQRFTVGGGPGATGYNLLNPGLATYTTISTAITAAAAGTADGMTLMAASSTSRRLVELQPLTRSELVAMVPWVNVRGMGAEPTDTVIAAPAAAALSFATTAAGTDASAVENLTIRGSIALSFALGSGLFVFRRVHFDSATATAITASVGAGFTGTVVFEDCSGEISSFAGTGLGTLNVQISGTETGLDIATATTGFSLACVAANDLEILDNAYVRNTGVGGGRIATIGDGAASVNDVQASNDATLDTGNATSPLFQFSSTSILNSLRIERIQIGNTLPSLFTVVGVGGSVVAKISEYTILAGGIAAGNAPLPTTGVGSQETLRRDALYNVRRYPFAVPVPAAAVLDDFYVTNAPNAAGVDFDAFADIHLVTPNYGDIVTDPIDGVVANIGVTFRYALFRLPSPTSAPADFTLEDGRVYIIKNGSNPADDSPAASGPVAIALAPTTTATVDYLSSTTASNITSLNFVILGPGDSVKVMVDRTAGMWRIVG